ncbi:prepilin-type N-terminal cleavage/methylation domain-containing protein [Patescibacteria group bacterium]|nr:MAG: prepilin-type N-terminal cleavage/methylation domain-containing protein [Patescibacteria group bacterium]
MNKKGFTLIELLVVVAIIGLLSTLAVVALGNARTKARDSKRLSDLKQIQTALELYYTDNSGYPAAATGQNLGVTGGSYVCLSSAGFAATGCADPYMAVVPKDPKAGQNYVYTSTASSSYSVVATLEGNMNGMSGTVTLSQSGIAD